MHLEILMHRNHNWLLSSFYPLFNQFIINKYSLLWTIKVVMFVSLGKYAVIVCFFLFFFFFFFFTENGNPKLLPQYQTWGLFAFIFLENCFCSTPGDPHLWFHQYSWSSVSLIFMVIWFINIHDHPFFNIHGVIHFIYYSWTSLSLFHGHPLSRI